MSSGRLNNPKYLVGAWSLNGNAKDTSGYGNDGTWTTEAYVESSYNKKLTGTFNNSTSQVNCGDKTIHDITKGTICA